MDQLHQIGHQVASLPPEVWQMALVGVIASLKLQVIKRFKDLQTFHIKLILGWVYLLGALVVYIINSDPLLHNQIAGLLAQVGIAGITASPFYYVFIKGLWGGFIKNYVTEAKQYESMVKSAAIPPEGLPLDQVVTPAAAAKASLASDPDFS